MGKRNYPKEYEIVIEFIKTNKDQVSKGELNFLLGYAANLKSIISQIPKDEIMFPDDISEKPTDEELMRNIFLSLKVVAKP